MMFQSIHIRKKPHGGGILPRSKPLGKPEFTSHRRHCQNSREGIMLIQRSHVRKQRLHSILTAAAMVCGTVAAISVPATAQFPADSTIPKAKRGKARQLGAFAPGPAPKKDGHVDLSAVWGYSGYTSDIAKDYDVGEVPMTPRADKFFKEVQANQ